jgi:hypothetical protein
MTPEEQREFDELEREERLLELRRGKVKRDFDATIRQMIAGAIEERDRPRVEQRDGSRHPPFARDLAALHITRAYRHDLAGTPRGCTDGSHTHAPGSLWSVACRLEMSRSSLIRACRRLYREGDATMAHWPPGEIRGPARE